ncbi:MAG: ABC transporter ATP-binding protein [Clostridia bacterium]|nr:ABC transporter ATP-binding protein [Clostridia bacterium]
MKLRTRKYTVLDCIGISLRCSPVIFPLRTLLTLGKAFIPAVSVTLTAQFVDAAIAAAQGEAAFELIFEPLLLLLLTIAYSLFQPKLLTLLRTLFQNDLRLRFRTALLDRRARLDYKCIENSDDWDVMRRLNTPNEYKSPEAAMATYASALVLLISAAVTIISVTTLIAAQVWWVALLICVALVPLVLLSMKSGEKNYDAFADVSNEYRKTTYLNEVLTFRETAAERTVFGYTDAVREDYRQQSNHMLDKEFKAHKAAFASMNMNSIVVGAVSAACMGLLLIPALSGAISFGMFIGLFNALATVISLMRWTLINNIRIAAECNKYMQDLTRYVHMPSDDSTSAAPDRDIAPFESLEFRDVRFTYPTGEHPVLNGLSFTMRRGGHYAFVGANGAGKTTITKLVTGLYREYEGQILLNGVELREYTPAQLKAYFACVFQDFARYHISFKENIALGDERADEAAVLEAAHSAGLDELIEKNGLDAHIGKLEENGVDVSGGEWQRIAMARCIISPAQVKILDEPTAALDPIAESEVYENFRTISSGHTTVLISHRLGSTKLADTIFVLDGGKVVESGSFDELMALNGLYATMFESQRSWYI